KAIGDLFSRVVDSIKSGITWFNNLSSSQQKMIMKFGAVVIAAGPLLTAFGVLGGVIAKLSSGLGTFFKFLAPIMTPLKNIAPVAAEGGKKIGLLSRAFTFLTGPVGIVIGIRTLLATGFITAYKKSETFRNIIKQLGTTIKNTFSKMMDWIQPGIDAVVGFFGEVKDKILSFKNEEGAQLTEAFQNVGKIIMFVLSKVWEH